MTRTIRHAAALALLAAVGVAHATVPLDGTGFITADNHYAIYARTTQGIMLVGGNELGAAGDPGTFNWTYAEIHEMPFDLSDIYIAAWSDDDAFKGLLAQFYLPGETIYTGDARWRVYSTGQDLDDNAPYPLAADIARHAAHADALNLWEIPYAGPQNLEDTPHWGEIGGIDPDARWIWRDVGESPLTSGGDLGEYLIFHISPVPSPGSAALLAIAGLALPGRKRAR